MKTLTVAKGEPYTNEIEGCLISISDPFQRFTDKDWEEKALDFYEAQATIIVDALWCNLPGGTFDAVLRELLRRKASLFRVPKDTFSS